MLKWANKECKNFDICNKKRKMPGDIIILYLCAKKLDDMINSSWDIECDRLKLVIMGHFLPCPPSKKPKIQNFEKMKKITGDIIIFHMSTKKHNHMRYGSWNTEWETEFIVSLGHFLPFYPTNNPKNQNFEKMKKRLKISSFYTNVPKIMIKCYTVPEIWRVTDVIVIFHFGLFFALLPS